MHFNICLQKYFPHWFQLNLIFTHISSIFPGDDEHKRPARMQPINSESILTKEQLFDMFQQILSVKKFEHQILFNALMVSENKFYKK
jgi:hypothetical protein